MDIAKLMVGFVVIAAIVTLIGVVVGGIVQYWPYLLLIGAVAYGLYALRQKRIDKRNEV